MHKIQGPFRLVHWDRRNWTCATIREVFDKVTTYRYALAYKSFDSLQIGETWVFRTEWFIDRHCWVVCDSTGLIVPLWWLKNQHAEIARDLRAKDTHVQYSRYYRFNKHLTRDRYSTDWSVFRGKTLPHSGRSRWNSRRCPRTTQEIREQQRVCEELAEYDIKVRPRRKLPTAWDDLIRASHYERNWKRHRKTQWKR